MIKCSWFGKSLKQFFIISLISCFTLLVGSSVNAWTYWGGTTGVNNDPIFGNWLIYQPVNEREYYNNYGLVVDTYGDFDTFYNTGNSQLVLYFPRSGQPYQYGQVYYGWIDGKLYYYGDYAGELNNNRYTTQGFIQNFCKTTKDLLLDVNNGPYNHCDYDLPAEEFYSQPHNFVNIFSMSSNGSRNAFVTDTYRTFCLEESNGIDVYCWSCSMYDNQNHTWLPINCNSGLSGSLNFNITDFNDVSSIPFDFGPFSFPSGGNGSGMYGTGITGPTTGNINNTFTGDYKYLKCTYKVILDQLESSGFSKYLCYGGLDNFDLYNSESTYNPVPGTGKTLGQILAHSSSRAWSPVEWYNFWNGLRGGYTAMWESYPAVYKTWFDIYYQYQGNSLQFESVYEYCILRVSDVDFENTVYNGKYFGFTCDYVKREIINGGGSFDLSGNVIVGVDWSGVGNLSGDKVSDPVVYIQDFFNLLKENLGTRTDSGVGAIPSYIILFLLAIILFRFIKR